VTPDPARPTALALLAAVRAALYAVLPACAVPGCDAPAVWCTDDPRDGQRCDDHRWSPGPDDAARPMPNADAVRRAVELLATPHVDDDPPRAELWDALREAQAATRLLARAVVRDDATAAGIARGLLADEEITGLPLRREGDRWVWDGWYAQLLTAAFVETLATRPPDDPTPGPLNYLAFSVRTPAMDVEVMIQRKDGRTPADVAAEATAEVARLRAEVARLRRGDAP
jgi:hypothetical protein